MLKMSCCFFIFLLLAPLSVALNAQGSREPVKLADDPVQVELTGDEPIQVEVHLVNIEARVTHNGDPVRHLTRDDFRVTESGKEQEIAFFHYVETPSVISKQRHQNTNGQSSPATGIEGAFSGTIKADQPESGSDDSSDPTWLHLVIETADPVEFMRTSKAIRSFVEIEMQPGFYVSLGGMPFTDNKNLLLSTLDRLEGKPYGKGSGIDPSLIHLSDLEIMRDIALSIPFAPDIESIEDALQTTAVFEGPLDQAPVIGVETVNRQIRFFGELAMLRYMDLVERMALLPGRKAIAVFRRGLRLDHETEPILDRLLSMAARNRVSFYTVDSLGLDVVSPVKDYRYPLAWSRGRLENYLPDPVKEAARRREAEEGLVVLAKETGGHAVLDSNDLGSILSRVVQDSFSYYVLGYYPENFSGRGRFRKIEVSLKENPGYQISAVRGYSEPKELRLQSRAERLVSLRKSMEVSTSRDLDVRVEPEIFPGPDGNPLLFVSVGAPARDFDLKKRGRTSSVDGEILIQIVNHFSQKIPLYHNGRIDESFDNAGFDDPVGPLVNYQTVLPLSPGIYELRAIIRDSRSGKFGVHSSSFMVKDFQAESVSSSLLMTRYTTSGNVREEIDPEDWHRRVLSAGEIGYYPQPASEFRRGEIVHVLFHLYRPTREDREWAEKGMQIGVFHRDAEAAIDGIRAQGQAFIDCNDNVIRYAVMFDTSSLDPGEYKFLALLPNYENRKIPHLEEMFLIVD